MVAADSRRNKERWWLVAASLPVFFVVAADSRRYREKRWLVAAALPVISVMAAGSRRYKVWKNDFYVRRME